MNNRQDTIIGLILLVAIVLVCVCQVMQTRALGRIEKKISTEINVVHTVFPMSEIQMVEDQFYTHPTNKD